MRRTEVLQGIRLMKFSEILDRTRSRELSQGEAASVLGVSERTFRRWRGRYDAEGASSIQSEGEKQSIQWIGCRPNVNKQRSDPTPEGFTVSDLKVFPLRIVGRRFPDY